MGQNPRELAKTIGATYVNGSFETEYSPEVREAYSEIVNVNRRKFDRLLEEHVDVVFTEEDPYDSYEEMKESVEESGVFKVFSGGSYPPLMSRSETVIGRAVHDYYGHLEADCDFSFLGEFQKWDHVRHDYSGIAQLVMFAEVVGQVSAAYYLPDGFESDRFEQRAIAAPGWWVDQTRKCFEENR